MWPENGWPDRWNRASACDALHVLRFRSGKKSRNQSVPGASGTTGRSLDAVHDDPIDALDGRFAVLGGRVMMRLAAPGAAWSSFLLPQLFLLVLPLGTVMLLPIPLRILPADVVAALFTQKIFVPFDFSDLFLSPFHPGLQYLLLESSISRTSGMTRRRPEPHRIAAAKGRFKTWEYSPRGPFL